MASRQTAMGGAAPRSKAPHFVTAVALLLLTACVTVQLPRPQELRQPAVRKDNKGEFLCPYTLDGTLAEWTAEAVRVKAGGQIAGAFGTVIGIAAGGFPIFGTLAKQAGEAAGRSIALNAIGGWDKIRKTSEISFDSLDDMAVYLYAYYSAEPTYVDALDAAMTIYPELKNRYVEAIQSARRR